MSGSVRFLLRPEWLSGLGNMAGTPVSSVSPFKTGQNANLTDDDVHQLESGGILDSSGQISSAFEPVIRSMAAARSFTRVRLTGGEGLFEYVTYALDNSRDSFSLTTTPEGLEVRFPAPTTEIVEFLRQYIGDSLIRGSSFDAEVSNAEAVVLGSLIDIQRKTVLTALGEGKPGAAIETSIDMLQQSLASTNEDAQWILAVVKGLIESAPELSDLNAAVESLYAAGHIVKTASGIMPGRKLEILASRIPVVDKLLSLRSGLDLGNGQVVQVGFVCVQAGVNDMLMIESLGGRIHFEAVSPALVLEYVSHFINRPDVLNSVIVKINAAKGNKTAKEPVQTEKRVKDLVRSESTQLLCPACGSRIPQNGKFCISCGKPVDAPVKPIAVLCEQCGNPIKPEANFCNKCGVRINVTSQ